MWSKTEKMWSKLTITVYEDTECSDHSGNRANRKNWFFPFDIGTQNFYQLLLSSEIGLFEVENIVRNWIFVGNLVQYWFPFVKHGVEIRNFSVLNHVPDFKRSSEPRSRLQTELSPNLGGVGKSSGYLYRKGKNNSFDWWGFQSDPSTLTLWTRPHKL